MSLGPRLALHHEKSLTELLPDPREDDDGGAMSTTLAALVKRHRSAAELTQEELAEKAGISARTVSDVERGLRTRIYRDTARRLAKALGLDEDARTAFEAAARGPRPEPLQAGPTLPIPLTRLIGRERELELVIGALEGPDVRLLTLTGPGGIGKTRIALEVAARARFPDGVFFVQLANTSNAQRVIPAIAHAIGVSGATVPTIDAIAEHLLDTRTLVVLDTFERVLEAAADVAELLAACPGATVLATSREALRVRGEHEVAIPTLETPAQPTIDQVVASPATALFIERALAVLPSLTIDEASAEIIAKICRCVNGLPLAIELAAARVKHLSLPALRDQLEHRLNVLVGGARDLPRRQQTMRDTVAWSYALLEAQEREVFRDLSVFSGGWTLESASAVCATDVLESLSFLVDKSLVVLTGGDEPRYGMLDVVREYGAELRENRNAEDRHLGFFLSLAEEAEPELGLAAQHSWMQRLTREHDNIRIALRRTIERRDAEPALRLAGAVWRFWLLHGDLTEGRNWLQEALGLDPVADPRARIKALWGLAWLFYHQGDHPMAARCGDELVELTRASEDPVEVRNALTIRGIVDLAYGRYSEAIVPLERCVDLLRNLGPTWLLATSMLNLGTAMIHAGEDRARSVLEGARDLYIELGDEHFAARAELYIGYAALSGGERERAATLFRESLITFWELEDLWGTTEALEALVTIAAAGHPGRAVRIAGAADALRETINLRPFPADRALRDRSLDDLRPTIAASTWRAAWEKGRAMTVEEAVDEALHMS